MGTLKNRRIGLGLSIWLSPAPISIGTAVLLDLSRPELICIAVTALLGVAIVDLLRRNQRAACLRAQLEAVITSPLDPLLACDQKGEILFASDSVQGTFGWQPGELIGRNVSCLMPEPYASCHDSYLAEYLCTGISRVMGQARQLSGQRKDGSVFACEISVSPFGGPRSKSQGFVGVLRDISKRLDDEQTLRDARHAAEEANRAKSAFLANVSHELLTPLTSITAASEILDRMASDEDLVRRAEFTQIIHKESLRMSRLVKELLDMASYQAGGKRLRLTSFDLRDVLQDSIGAVRSLAMAKAQGLRADMGREEARVRGDRDRLQQALMNVLANAIKFSPASSEILCLVRVTPKEIRLRICDRGPGVPTEDCERVFEKFYQCGDLLTDKPTGSGLGLAITREILRRHSGEVVCRSRLLAGTEFVFTLPRWNGDEPAMDNEGILLGAQSGL